VGSRADLDSKGTRENSCLWSENSILLLTKELRKDDIVHSQYMRTNFMLGDVWICKNPVVIHLKKLFLLVKRKE
jgi:hypothetical protein